MVDGITRNSIKDSTSKAQSIALDAEVYCEQEEYRLETQGKYSEIPKLYQQFISKYPGSVYVKNALYRQADCYYRHLKDYNKALEIYHRIIDKYPDSNEAGFSLQEICELYKETRKFSDLIHVLEEMGTPLYPAARFHTKKEKVLFEMGFIYEHHLNNPTKALSIFKRVIKEYPQSVWAAASAAEMHLSSGDTENAIRSYRGIFEQDFPSHLHSDIDLSEKLILNILDRLEKMGTTIIFSTHGDLTVEDQKQILAYAFLILPLRYFEKLKVIDFTKINMKSVAAKYSPSFGHSGIAVSDRNLSRLFGISTIIHELMHHWDVSIDKEVLREMGIKVPAKDPSSIYYSISWSVPWLSVMRGNKDLPDLSSIYYRISWHSPWLPVMQRNRDFANFVGVDGIMETDGRKYGMVNQREDFATFGTAYTFQEHNVIDHNLRLFIRAQMSSGNFKPAAKYLYVRFCTPFLGEEFNISKDDPSLGFVEVKNRLNKWLENHPGSVNKSTIEAINKIEDVYKSYPAKDTK